jgi:HNH endonuclease
VIGGRWNIWGEHAHSSDFGKYLHQVIIGDRPSCIPEEWVIDHSNRNKLDNRRNNLMWVSSTYNSWNTETRGLSKFKGVHFDTKLRRWVAKFLGQSIGTFHTERDAGRLVATAALATWAWVEHNDLITRHFDPKEIAEMKRGGYVPRDARLLPKGVHYDRNTRKFRAFYRRVHIGSYTTVSDAEVAYNKRVKECYDREWSVHLQTPVTRDSEGYAIIHLSGLAGKGKVTKVPERFWHILSFKNKWSLGGRNDKSMYVKGVWESKQCQLHAVVWKLINPDFKPKKGWSIDHIIPENKLDNREENLRWANRSGQARNKIKRGEGKYPGVTQNKYGTWRGTVRANGSRFCTPCVKTEKEAALLLNKLRIKHLGSDTILNKIKD